MGTAAWAALVSPVFVYNIRESRLVMKYLIMHRARGGAPTSPEHRSALLGQSLTWRTRLQPIRTASEVSVKIIIQPLQRIPLYQKLAKKVEELLLLGMSFRAIGRSLGVNKRTVMRAYEYINRPLR